MLLIVQKNRVRLKNNIFKNFLYLRSWNKNNIKSDIMILYLCLIAIVFDGFFENAKFFGCNIPKKVLSVVYTFDLYNHQIVVPVLKDQIQLSSYNSPIAYNMCISLSYVRVLYKKFCLFTQVFGISWWWHTPESYRVKKEESDAIFMVCIKHTTQDPKYLQSGSDTKSHIVLSCLLLSYHCKSSIEPCLSSI